jgi:hypothetical protein
LAYLSVCCNSLWHKKHIVLFLIKTKQQTKKKTETNFIHNLRVFSFQLQWVWAERTIDWGGLKMDILGSISERFQKIGRGFINIIKHVFFCFGQIFFFWVLWIFEKLWSCAKKMVKSRNWHVFALFFEDDLVVLDFYSILRIFVNIRFFQNFFLSDLWLSKQSC